MYTILAGHREISTIRSVDPVIAGDVLPAPNTPLRPIGRMHADQEAGASSGAPSLARANVNENTTYHRRYTRSGALPQDASTRTSPTFVKGGRPSRCAEKSTTVASESKEASRTSA